MLYITESPLSLVAFYASKKQEGTIEVLRKTKSLDLVPLLCRGTIFKPAILVIELNSNSSVEGLMQSEFNTTYLCVSSITPWREIIQEKPWIKELVVHPELYKTSLDKLKGIFENSADEVFWARFKNFPQKLNMELTKFLIQFSISGEKITREDVDLLGCNYVGSAYGEYMKEFGNPKSTAILRNLSSGALWTLFVGSDNKPSYIYSQLVGNNRESGRCPDLYLYVTLFQELVKAGKMDVKIAFILFNDWVTTVGVKRNGRFFSFSPSVDDISKLYKLVDFK